MEEPYSLQVHVAVGAWAQERIEGCRSVDSVSVAFVRAASASIRHCSLGWECNSGRFTMHCILFHKNSSKVLSVSCSRDGRVRRYELTRTHTRIVAWCAGCTRIRSVRTWQYAQSGCVPLCSMFLLHVFLIVYDGTAVF